MNRRRGTAVPGPARDAARPEAEAPPRPGPPAGEQAGLGRAGLAATALSVALTVTIAVLGPSVMEPALPGRPGQPPWAFAAHPSGYLVVALTLAAIVAGTAGLGVTMRAARRGWGVSPRLVLAAGLAAAALLACLPPFGSSDHLSYAAYGRMLVTGHNPYLMTPQALARLGDPVARAVQDWKNSASVYGVLATGGQALASLIGGTSVRLTVFVLSLLNLAGFAGTGLLLHRLAGRDRRRQFRAALLWTANPLLLLVLVAGAHVDSQASVFGVAAVAAFGLALRAMAAGAARRCAGWAAAAGLLAGLGFAVKLSMVLVAAGLAVTCALGRPGLGAALAGTRGGALAGTRGGALAGTPAGAHGWGPVAAGLAGLAAGFAAVAAAALAIGGRSSLRPALQGGSYVAIGTPWRWVRAAISLASGEATADSIVKGAAAAAVLALAWLMLRRLPGPASVTGDRDRMTGLAARGALAFALAWLTAGPYVLPWYDGLAWALLPLLPWSVIDGLVLARTAALAIGYVPARNIAMPAGLGWLVTVVRRGITPALLLAVAVLLVIALRSSRPPDRAVPAEGSA